MNSKEDQNANNTSLKFISKQLSQVLDQLEIVTEELQEMKDREGGEH